MGGFLAENQQHRDSPQKEQAGLLRLQKAITSGNMENFTDEEGRW